MSAQTRIGILDSGVRRDAGLRLAGRARFFAGPDGDIQSDPGLEDAAGHGTEVTRLIRAAAPGAALIHAQVFGRSFESAPALVAAGLDWLVEQDVRIVNMSFGLRAERPVLMRSCAAALKAGVVLIAAAPAQGPPCYPAAHEGVIAVTGDARCATGEVSDLQGERADFGTWCASPERGASAGASAVAGASAAAAHFTGLAALFLSGDENSGREGVLEHFRASPAFIGAERFDAEAKRR
ncbi:MAG: subtilisin-like serine protease QhpE [Alphaproteobacteria bacterium]